MTVRKKRSVLLPVMPSTQSQTETVSEVINFRKFKLYAKYFQQM